MEQWRERKIALLIYACLHLSAGGVGAAAPIEEADMVAAGGGDAQEVVIAELSDLPEGLHDRSLAEEGLGYQAGLPAAYVHALRHAGVEADYEEFTALSGWAFSFGYSYGDISPAYLAVRGRPGGDGPYEVFQIAEWFGLAYEGCPTGEKDRLWDFVREHVGEGRPLISEHLDGGLIIGYRERDGRREVRFEGPVGKPWIDIEDLQPFEVCALVRSGEPLPKGELYLRGLQRAVHYASPHEAEGVPQGLAALEAYVADVADESKDFEGCGEYFCWAAFERLEARKCCATWLRRVGEELTDFGPYSAADRYQRAWELYEQFRTAVGGGVEGSAKDLPRRPETIAAVVPLLRRALNEERSALSELAVSLAEMGVEAPAAAGGASAGGAATEVREDLFALFWPLTAEQKRHWAQLMDRPDALSAALKARAPDYGCAAAELGDAIAWLDETGRAEALFCFVPQAGNLEQVRAAYRLIGETGAPVTYAFVRQPGTDMGEFSVDIFRLSAVSYLEHCNHFAGYAGEPSDAPLPRSDLFAIFDGMTREDERAWRPALGGPPGRTVELLAAMAGRYGCTGEAEGELVLWRDEAGALQAAFAYLPDPSDLAAVTEVHDAAARTGSPLTFALVHQAKDGEGNYDIFRLSTRSYMEHNNRMQGPPPARGAGAGHGTESIRAGEAAPDEPAGHRPERVVLGGVPKVGFGMIDGNVAMTPFPACLKACLEYMGDDLGFGSAGKYPRDAVYAYLMGTTGAAFRLSWKPGWHGDNVASWLVSDDPAEIFRRGFAAAGYEQMPSGHEPGPGKEERFRRMVIESIRDRGLPVIAHGVIGPPEECVIAGYDEDGRVAIGWSFFQDRPEWNEGVEFEPNGYFRKRGWEADTSALIAIGDRAGRPERREAYTDALQWALRVTREPVRYGDRHNGLAAYDAWAEHILRDDEVAAGTFPDDAFIVHCDAADVVAEGRWYASVFLKQAAEVLPEAGDQLLAAAECCKAEHDLVWRIWGIAGGNVPSEETRREFLKPEVRRRIAPLILQARDKDAEAAAHIEEALLALGAEAPDLPAGVTDATPAANDAEPTMLDSLTFPKWTITQLGCMAAGLDYLGHDVPRAWLYGGTAHAFFINVHEDVDLESVTAWDHGFVRGLAPNLGFRIAGFAVNRSEVREEVFRARQREAWRFVRRSILLGQPCYGWELKAPYGDFWLITSFDDVGYHYDGWETGGPTPWRKLGDQFVPVLEVRSIKLREPASDEVVVRDALAAALAHAQPGWDSSADADAHFGPDAYDAWAHALESGAALHNHHAYNAKAWHECREMAVEFLREARRRVPGRADADFDEAIAHYTVVRDRLAAVKELTPIDHELGWDEEPKLRSAEAAQLVREAGAAERQGLRSLARIAVALGADPARADAALAAAIERPHAEGRADMGADAGQDGVLLGDAVADFQHIAKKVASHHVVDDENVYPQPYCYLTTHLFQMHASGWDIDLDTLAAVSGASAFFGYERDSFMPKYAFHRYQPEAKIAEATGYVTEWVGFDGPERAWEIVVENVGRGLPVKGWEGEMLLFAGYRAADDPADREVFGMKDGNGYYAEWWPWERFVKWAESNHGFVCHAGRVEPRGEREVAVRVMRDLVALSEGVPDYIGEHHPDATFGLAGIAAYADDMPEAEDWGMCHPENPQWTVRNSSAVYLSRVAESGICDAAATPHIRRAAREYARAYGSWRACYRLVGYCAPDGAGKVKETRLAACAEVRKALEHETAAIAALRQALDAIDM
jgi:hypothetical protein